MAQGEYIFQNMSGEQVEEALKLVQQRDPEAYALGTRDGTAVRSGDPTYHNNSKYYSEQANSQASSAGASATAAAGSASAASTSATEAATSATNASASASAASADADRAEAAAAEAEDISGAHFVSWGIAQSLTDGQKQTARENIGMTDIVAPLINQWNEQYRIKPEASNSLETDRFPIKPGTTYYVNAPGEVVAYYYGVDGEQVAAEVHLGRNTTFTTPNNAYYMAFYIYAYGATYNHNISINYPSTYMGYYPPALPKTNAHIGMLGNVVVNGFNQIVKDPSVSGMWGNNACSISSSGGVFTLTATSTQTSGNIYTYFKGMDLIVGHKYYTCIDLLRPSTSEPDIWYFGLRGNMASAYPKSSWGRFEAIKTCAANNNNFILASGMTVSTGQTVQFRNPMTFDLTAMGLDSINTPEEFRALFPAEYYPYASGSWADLLWENASPTSAFAAQTISVDLSPYNMIGIEVKDISTAPAAKLFLTTKHFERMEITISDSLSAMGGYRRVTIASNGLTFGNAYDEDFSTQNNARAIPVSIYGIK